MDAELFVCATEKWCDDKEQVLRPIRNDHRRDDRPVLLPRKCPHTDIRAQAGEAIADIVGDDEEKARERDRACRGKPWAFGSRGRNRPAHDNCRRTPIPTGANNNAVISTVAKAERRAERSGETSNFSSPGRRRCGASAHSCSAPPCPKGKVRGFSTPLRSGRNDSFCGRITGRHAAPATR